MPDATYQPKVYRKQGGDELVIALGGNLTLDDGGGMARFLRVRATIAQVNAGLTILAAQAGLKYRLQDAAVISIGGAAGAVTTVDILGTRSAGSVKLLAAAQANLTQSTLIRAGGTGGTILADGASFTQLDVNTAITVGKTGSDITTATHIDFLLSYVLEP